MDERERLHAVRRAGGFTDIQLRDSGDGDNIAELRFLHLHALQALELVQLGDLGVFGLAVLAAEDHVFAVVDFPALHAADADAPDVVVVIHVGEQHLGGAVPVAFRRGDVFQDRIEQRLHVLARHRRVRCCIAVAAGSVHDREIELVLVCAQLDEQVDHLIHHLRGAGARAVDFIDDHQGLFAEAERFFQNEAGLRHAALERIHQKQHAVHHHQDALHLPAEIGMAGGVDDVDFRALVPDGGIFRKNCDPALALQIVGIHHAFFHFLIGPENAALPQKLVDQGRFSVVYVRDDRNVSYIIS